MKLALLLPGYIESPDYRHLVDIDEKLTQLGYTTIRVDACDLWKKGDVQNYTTSKYIAQVKGYIDSYLPKNSQEIILIGHSLGSLVALFVGNLYSEVCKIVCVSPPLTLNNSDHKWINGFRISKKDLPDSPINYREFSVPISFTDDRKQYSISDSFKNNKRELLVVMGERDPSTVEYKKILNKLNIKNFIVIQNMAHDFRQSEDLCNRVANEIEKFI